MSLWRRARRAQDRAHAFDGSNDRSRCRKVVDNEGIMIAAPEGSKKCPTCVKLEPNTATQWLGKADWHYWEPVAHAFDNGRRLARCKAATDEGLSSLHNLELCRTCKAIGYQP